MMGGITVFREQKSENLLTALTEYVIKATNDSAVIKAQAENTKTDIISGLDFDDGSLDDLDDEAKAARFEEYVEKLKETEKAQLEAEGTYVLNVSSKRIHMPYCVDQPLIIQ